MDMKNSQIQTLMAEMPFETWYLNYAGPVCSKFLTELRDHKRILGIKCPECNRVLVRSRW